jgi:hypothetical protein
MTVLKKEQQRRGRLNLLALILMPIVVVVLATIVFYTRIGLPEGTRNRGELITPPLQFKELPMRDIHGADVKLEESKNMWTFLLIFPSSCTDHCKKQMWETRQTRVALGKYQGHIRRAWLVAGGEIDQPMKRWLAEEHPDIQLLYTESASLDAWIGRSAVGKKSLTEARFYLADPRGFVMMYYDQEDTYKDTITDMKFLLKGVE